MLKRQRPATPPPSSLGDSPSMFLQDGLTRPLQPLHAADLSQPRSKRQRMQPPPLDGTLRGLLESEPRSSRWESDGEEDWIEEPGLVLPPSTTASQYKNTNSLLHELHVLSQHRLIFAHSPLLPLNPNLKMPLPAAQLSTQDPTAGHKSPFQPAFPCLPRDGFAGRNYVVSTDKGLVEEVQLVRQRYEGANRLLGSLFLSRRREVEGVTSSAAPGPCG